MAGPASMGDGWSLFGYPGWCRRGASSRFGYIQLYTGHGLWHWVNDMGMDQYLLIPFLVGWTSIYQLFWNSPGVPGFWPIGILLIEWFELRFHPRFANESNDQETQDTVLGQGAQPPVTMSQSPISRASFDPADRSLGKSVQGGCTSHPDRGAMFIQLCCIYSHHCTTRFFMFFLVSTQLDFGRSNCISLGIPPLRICENPASPQLT